MLHLIKWLLSTHRRTALRSLPFDRLFEAAPDGIVVVDEGGRIAITNKQALLLFGYSAEELAGQPIELLVPERARGHHVGQRRAYQHTRPARRMGSELALKGRRKEGSEFPVDIALSTLSHRGRALTLAFIRDATSQQALWDDLASAKAQVESELLERRQFRALNEVLQTLRSVSEMGPVLCLHMEHLFPGLSGFVFLLTPARDALDAVVSWGPDASFGGVPSSESCLALQLGKPHHATSAPDSIRCEHLRSLGGEALCVPMLVEGEPLGLVSLFSGGASASAGQQTERPAGRLSDKERQRALDVADRLAPPLANVQLRDTLRGQSIRDALTGVHNRRYLEEMLPRELNNAALQGRATPLVMLDLDHFKQVNDTHGHGMGDVLLRTFGHFLNARFRSGDIVCRFGGEEFAIILQDATADAAATRIDRLRMDWKAQVLETAAGLRVRTTFSAGVAIFPHDALHATALVSAADTALYRAKAEGRDRVVKAGVLMSAD